MGNEMCFHPNNSSVCEMFRVEATGNADKESVACAHERCSGVRWSQRKQCDCDGVMGRN